MHLFFYQLAFRALDSVLKGIEQGRKGNVLHCKNYTLIVLHRIFVFIHSWPHAFIATRRSFSSLKCSFLLNLVEHFTQKLLVNCLSPDNHSPLLTLIKKSKVLIGSIFTQNKNSRSPCNRMYSRS